MYQPAHRRFEVSDPQAALAELCAVVPATLVTAAGGELRSTILPMLFERHEGPNGTLRGHVARGNPHWRVIADAAAEDAMAIFSGPDAYVSPALYVEKQRTGKVVPTWNYVTVSVHGTLTLHHEPEWLRAHVRQLVDRHESGRTEPWSIDDAPTDYVDTQLRAIVGLELAITRIDARRKLSQNRSAEDVTAVIAAFTDGTPGEQAVAAEMRREPTDR